MNNKKSMYNAIYHCPSKKTTTACSKVLADELNMDIIETIKNGDCFFDTLATYGWAYHYSPLEHSHQELRQIMVNHMRDYMHLYYNSIIANENKGETVESMIESLRPDGIYANDMGDLLSQIAADLFHVNIYIYNVEPPIIRRLRATEEPHPGTPMHMLRVGQHYKLLLPQKDAPHVIGSYASAHKNSKQSKAAVSKTAKNSNNSKNGNNGNSVNNLSKALKKASISNHTHKNHGNNSNHGIYEFNEKMDYKKITIKDLIAFLLSNNMNDNTYAKIEAISSLQKKKEAYYALYEELFKKK